MSSSSDASSGIWTDYSLGFWNRKHNATTEQSVPAKALEFIEWQILATDYWAQWMSAFVAVCLTLTNPYVFRIIISVLRWPIHGLDWLKMKWKQSNDHSASQLYPSEARPLLSPEYANDYETLQQPESNTDLAKPKTSPSATATQTTNSSQMELSSRDAEHSRPSGGQLQPVPNAESPVGILKRSSDSSEAVEQFIRFLRHKGTRLSEKAFVVVLITAIFGLFVAQTIAGIFSAQIASDRAALSSSKQCGIWEVDYNVGDETGYRNDLRNHGKEARASQYARQCYSLPEPTDPVGCGFFYNRSIDFETRTQQLCPFTSQALCANGLYSAVTFDTGYIDAGIIGINSPILYKFRRRSSCSPLNMSEPYVQENGSQGSENTTYRYYYGCKDSSNSTFQTSGIPFDWLVPTYSANTYFSSFYPDSDYWKPLQDLKPSSNNTLTIIFVVSNHIYHEEASFDPIFPATEPRYFPEETKPYYYNSDPRARVLACADSTELCSPNGQTCWNMTAHLPQGVPDMPAYWFMKWSLENSNTYEAIKWRLGNALLAQESISQSVSKPLPSNQWEIEASQLFATSLARIQYDAWAIARGEDHELPGYVEVTPAEARGRLCRLYKFNSVGYTNVNLLGFIGLPLAAIVVWILSWEIKTPAMESGAAVGKTSSGHADTTAVTADDTTNGTTESTAEATTSGTITKTSPAAIPTTTASTRTGHSGHKNHDSGSMVIDIIAKFIGLKILDLIVGTYRCSARAGRALARLWKDRRKPWTNPQVEP